LEQLKEYKQNISKENFDSLISLIWLLTVPLRAERY
jgi:hypothetical protein